MVIFLARAWAGLLLRTWPYLFGVALMGVPFEGRDGLLRATVQDFS